MEQGTTPARIEPPAAPDGVPTSSIMAKARDENFSVASRLLPAAVRPHLLAVYGFARLVDDIGDEAEGDRVAQLDWIEHDLDRALAGQAIHPLVQRLGRTILACSLPAEPFHKLIEANRLDQVVLRYSTFADLLGYCQLSANPVGEIVLRIFGVATPDRLRWSDDVCTGLQIVEHLQDIGEDARHGRVYLPAEDLDRFGCPDQAVVASSADPRLRDLILFETDRAAALLGSGVALAASLHGRVRLGVAAFAAGGLAVVDAIRAAEGDTLGVRCRPRRERVVQRWLAIIYAAATRRH